MTLISPTSLPGCSAPLCGLLSAPLRSFVMPGRALRPRIMFLSAFSFCPVRWSWGPLFVLRLAPLAPTLGSIIHSYEQAVAIGREKWRMACQGRSAALGR